MKLYFIAIIPHEDLKERVKQLKEEMSSHFHARHALKSPAHITLQMPFKKPEREENPLLRELERFALTQTAFQIHLDGFGHFSNRVIFIKPRPNPAIFRLHADLNQVLKKVLNFEEKDLRQEIHPHMTIATRDLSPAAFQEAWPQFEQRLFLDSFEVSSIFLLKHNGKYWDIYQEFSFKEFI